MKTESSVLGWVWRVVTIILGLGLLLIVLYPQALSWVGVTLSQRESAVMTWAIVLTVAWFIIGDNKVTWTVAEFEKTAPFALLLVGVVLTIVWQGSILVQALKEAGFGLTNILIMVAGMVAIVGAILWFFVSRKS